MYSQFLSFAVLLIIQKIFFLDFANEKDEKKILFSTIKTLWLYAQNLHKYCGNNKRANKEYKEIGSILCYYLNLYKPRIMCIQTINIFEKMILLNQSLGKQVRFYKN